MVRPVRKFFNLSFLCTLFFAISMLCIFQYVVADVPHFYKSIGQNNDVAIIMSKVLAGLFPIGFSINLIICILVKKKKIKQEDYEMTVTAVAAASVASGNLGALSTLTRTEEKYNAILSLPLIFPINVFFYLLCFALQLLLAFAAATSGGWEMQDIFSHWQWLVLIFGGSFFLLATFVLSFFGLYQSNGRKEVIRQALVLVAISACLIILFIYGAVRAELEDPGLHTFTPPTYVAKAD